MQSFKNILKPVKGVVTDFSNEDIPEGFAIESVNGRFIPTGGAFTWVSVRGEKEIPITGDDWTGTYILNKVEPFQGKIIAFVTNLVNAEAFIIRLTPVYSADKSIDSFTAKTLVYDQYNAYLQISGNNPVSKCRIMHETGTIYTIYWNDRVNALKSIRIINDTGELSSTNFSQRVTLGEIKFNGIVDGALPGGAMFYAYRLLGKNGAVTDWSMAMGPVMVPNKKASATPSWNDYSSVAYAKPDEKSACGISLTIEGVDTTFYKIQLAAVVSNQNSTFERGYICIEERIADRSTITLSHVSDASYGLVTPEEVQVSTQAITGCQDFDIVNNIMVLIGPRIDSPLTEDGIITANRVTGADLKCKVHPVQFDNQLATTVPAYDAPPMGCVATAQSVAVSKFKNQVTAVNESFNIDIPAGFTGYKNPVTATLLRNCWRGETYRLALIPVSKYGKRLGARFLGDITIPQRGGASTSVAENPTSNEVVRPVDEVANKYVANIVSIIAGNIDISQWVHEDGDGNPVDCDIQGFHIAVSPREKQALHEGLLFASANHVRSDESLMSEYGVILGNRYDSNPTPNMNTSRPVKRLYQYYSPDVQNELLPVSEPGQLLRIEEQCKGLFTMLLPNGLAHGSWPAGYSWHETEITHPGASDSFSPFHYTKGWNKQNSEYKGPRMWNKYYRYLASGDAATWTLARNPALRQTNEIDGYYDLPAFNAAEEHGSQKIYIAELGQKAFINAYWGKIVQTASSGSSANVEHDAFGGGAACRLIITKTIEGTDYDRNPYATAFTNGATIVSSRNNSALLYGGTSDSAIEKSIYRSCWHYQPITNAILAKIKRPSDGKYIFDNVEIFAGDSYIVPFAVARLSHGINYGTAEHPIPDPANDFYPTNAFMVPVQSNLNYTMCDGDLWLKHRGLKAFINNTNTNNTITGIGVIKLSDTPAYGRLEKTEYPSLANVVYGQNIYYTLPESLFYTEDFPMRVFWSNRKVDAEETDSFRVFAYENYQSIQGDYGIPVAVRSSMENAIIWCQNAIGAIPVDERSAVSDESGKQLSIGRASGVGKFTVIDREHGLQHFFSLSQNGENFTWFDFGKREWAYWGKRQGITDLSEKYKFQADISFLFSDISLFDESIVNIRTMFGSDGEIMLYKPGQRTFVFDTLNNIYQGHRDIIIGDNLLLNSLPVTAANGKLTIPGFGIQNKAYGNFVSTFLTMVANRESMSQKVFESFRLTGENIQEILLTSDKVSFGHSLIKILGVDKRLWKYSIIKSLNNLYVGEIPLNGNYDYLRGFYTTVKFAGFPDTQQVKLSNLILNLRKDIE
jgi:hypothetical protein